MTRRDTGLAAYIQRACNCRPGYLCRFCRRWLTPDTPRTATVRSSQSEDETTWTHATPNPPTPATAPSKP